MQYPSYRTMKSAEKPKIIKVTGEGIISIRPDQAEITLGVSTEDANLSKALEINANKIGAIIQTLYNLGMKENEIQTSHYSISPQYDYIDGKQTFRNYRVEHLLHLTVKDIQKVGMIVDGAVTSGANEISAIQFSSSQYHHYYEQALSKAVINAIQKANTIAQTIKVQLSQPPKSITELPLPINGPIPFQSHVLMKSESATSVQPGTMDISSQVEVVFNYF